MQVWRKIWMQITRARGFAIPTRDPAIRAFERVKTTLAEASEVTFQPASAPTGTYYKKWMFKPGAADVNAAVIGKHNKAHFFSLLNTVAGETPKAHIVVCELQWDTAAASGVTGPYEITSFTTQPDGTRISNEIRVALDRQRGIINPPLQGGDLVVTGQWSMDGTTWEDLDPNPIVIKPNRTSVRHIKVKLPAAAPNPTIAAPVKVRLDLQVASGPWLGESDGPNVLAVYNGDDVDFCDTITHEIGHSLEQTAKQPLPSGVVNHPYQYDQNGSHCNYQLSTSPCVMYESGPQPAGLHRFCDECHPYLIIQKMESFS
jgi:hypothetical protein